MGRFHHFAAFRSEPVSVYFAPPREQDEGVFARRRGDRGVEVVMIACGAIGVGL